MSCASPLRPQAAAFDAGDRRLIVAGDDAILALDLARAGERLDAMGLGWELPAPGN